MDAEQTPESNDFSSQMETFPKTRLFPEFWDLSEYSLSSKTMPKPAHVDDAQPDPFPEKLHIDPFPKLNTFPGGWDLA